MNRFVFNNELLNHLSDLIDNNPDMRFGQILQNFGFIKPNRPANPDNMVDWQNEFYLESEILLKRVEQRIKDMESVD